MAENEQLIEQYRSLVGALLGHTHLDHEGSEQAIGDFIDTGDSAARVLQELIKLQYQDLADEAPT